MITFLEKVKAKINNKLSPEQILLIDNSYLHKDHNNFDGNNETHILVQLKKNCKLELNRLEIHRKINSLLSKEFDRGLHSLEIKII